MLQLLDGKSVLERSVGAFLSVPDISFAAVVIMTREEEQAEITAMFAAEPRVSVIRGGASRQDSVCRGIEALRTDYQASDEAKVFVHDAARCCVSASVIRGAVHGLEGADAVVPGVAVSDTLKRADAGGIICETVSRTDLWAVQTPQGFRLGVLARAHQLSTGNEATDDASLVEAIASVQIFPGDPSNIKVTTPVDLQRAELLIRSAGGV